MDLKSTLCALLVVAVWGINFSVIKLGLAELPPILFSGLRFLIVALPAIFFIPFPKTPVWHVLGVGLFLGVIKFGLLFVAMEKDASAGIASLLLQAQVVFTIVLSALVLKEQASRFQVAGAAIACTGFGMFFLSETGSVTLYGMALILCAALSWAVSNLIMKQLKQVNLLHFMVWVSAVAPLPLFVLSYNLESNVPVALIQNTSAQTWLALLYVGPVSTLLAFALWGWLLGKHRAAAVTPFALLIPLVGMIGASVILGEQISLFEVVGGAVILSGLTFSVLGERLCLFFSGRTGFKRKAS
ncbi:EamA family transporter [Pseudoalteromonas sp. DL2-H2.2]|uniref:EamA family transporter n=1 Tax=Pseudoalteromonas sp. DL2-H2.2 TaxID=2908889 RepID=UPI001F3B98A3|nr:EamA family transporter [Pseudoalteromonas sp. DL2-H2.2]MCF2909120.1 EamA family transporter [Pseudoalteromonas sp. DL2-H2.2]